MNCNPNYNNGYNNGYRPNQHHQWQLSITIIEVSFHFIYFHYMACLPKLKSLSRFPVFSCTVTKDVEMVRFFTGCGMRLGLWSVVMDVVTNFTITTTIFHHYIHLSLFVFKLFHGSSNDLFITYDSSLTHSCSCNTATRIMTPSILTHFTLWLIHISINTNPESSVTVVQL